MEHRCTERINSELEILIHKYNYPVAVGRIKNGSRGGVFVETEFADVHCEQRLSLEVSLSASGKREPKSIQVEALVIHKAEHGFGAAIDFHDAEFIDLFIGSLSNTQVRVEETQVLAMVV